MPQQGKTLFLLDLGRRETASETNLPSQHKTVGGKGRLTDKVIDKMQNYY